MYLLQSEEYKNLMKKQAKELITFLLKNESEFSLTANMSNVDFEPVLPDNLAKQFGKFSLFVLANYTYSSIDLEDEYISFEAGFGDENYPSLVKIPYYAIFQILVDDVMLFVNNYATLGKENTEKGSKELESKNKSMNVFKNNPKNSNFFKD